MSRVIISAESLTKTYRLGVINHDTLRGEIRSWWARKRGLPDPTLKIGNSPSPRSRPTFNALEDITFDVKPGETVGFIGKNGAGKSTLLKILSRVAAPNKGRVRIRGRVSSLLEVGTGFHPELTGRENVYLNGAILGMTKDEIRRKFDEIVAFAEIAEFIDTPVKRYSSGMYIRLAFAVAAHLEPEILIVDEVLAVGDYEFQRKCLGKMKDVRTEGRTVLFVSHNMTAVNNLCVRSILLEKGKIVADGLSADVTRTYLGMSSTRTQSHWQFADPSDGRKRAYIREAFILDADNGSREAYELTQDLQIGLRYRLPEPIRGLTVGLQILSEENNETLISLTDSELDQSRLETREAGDYVAHIRVPARILNTGTYSLRVGLSRGRQEVFHVVEGLNFRIIDSVGIVMFIGFERKGSLLSLQLPWKVEKEPRLTAYPDAEAV
ncbi:ABC transporter ATP-binding protein [Bradyrhizobium sp.]|uniref:ABC transporter ATP-binding protein n=1 Tax=Bradyrhizobium sp. TaxID=376 RepID=UPI00260FD390|nr:ABC transporter ATP-binding protein [Bradyrhizobium sp.]